MDNIESIQKAYDEIWSAPTIVPDLMYTPNGVFTRGGMVYDYDDNGIWYVLSEEEQLRRHALERERLGLKLNPPNPL